MAFRNRSRTVLDDQFAQAPYHVQRVMYCEESLPEMAYLYVMSSSGGIMDGDSHSMDVSLGDGARVHLTTQGATRVHGAGLREAVQATRITLGRDSYLEFIPDQIIPYHSSRYRQKTAIRAHDSATIVYAEVLSSGRVAMGESYAFGSCSLEVTATDAAGQLRFADSSRIEPSLRDVSAYGIMGGYRVAGSAYVLAPKRHVPEMCRDMVGLVSGGRDTIGGASVMQDAAGVTVRVLGNRAGDITGMMLSVAALVRRRVLGAPFSGVRK